jgi:hypothetical protein
MAAMSIEVGQPTTASSTARQEWAAQAGELAMREWLDAPLDKLMAAAAAAEQLA